MTKRATRGSKAATAANGHTLTQKSAPTISMTQGHGLAELAAQLADLESLYSLTFGAECTARHQSHCEAGVYTPAQVKASNDACLLDDVQRRTHDLTDVLQALILQSEPRNLDETLSLALVYGQQLAIYLGDLDENPESIKHGDMVGRERILRHATEAIIRGLVHGAGAKSPLLSKYACAREDLVPWNTRRQRAVEIAQRYPLKSERSSREAAEQ